MATSRDLVFGELTLRFSTDSDVPEGWFFLCNQLSGGWRVFVRGTNPATDMVRPVENWTVLYEAEKTKVWRAVPPAGYRALSDVQIDKDTDPAGSVSWKQFGCVKEAAIDGFS
ncbi:hypothetical protein ACWC5I_05035 [Kitasatospora sp. NPDC001574]